MDDEGNTDISLVRALPTNQQNYVALTGNYSVAGFEMTLRRKVSLYSIKQFLGEKYIPHGLERRDFLSATVLSILLC